MSIGFDTLRAAENLRQAGITETHAKAIVATMSNAIGEHVATKSDIADVKTGIASVRVAVRADLAEMRTEMAEVRTELAELKAALTWRIVLALGAFAALMRMMP